MLEGGGTQRKILIQSSHKTEQDNNKTSRVSREHKSGTDSEKIKDNLSPIKEVGEVERVALVCSAVSPRVN
jgi:hypothetical protein